MKIRILFIFSFLCITAVSLAQQKTSDVVCLHNGSIVKGSIIEYLVNDYVIIESYNGKVHRFNADEIKSVSADAGLHLTMKKNGYFNNTSFGVLLGENNFNNPLVNFTFNMVNGYRFNQRWAAGLGLGMDVIYRNLLFPVFFDTRFYLRKSEISPFIGAFAGYAFQTKKEDDPEQYYYYEQNVKSGRMYGFELGIRNYTKENFGYTFSIGYRFQYLSTTYPDWQYNTEILEEHYLNRFRFSFGVLFN